MQPPEKCSQEREELCVTLYQRDDSCANSDKSTRASYTNAPNINSPFVVHPDTSEGRNSTNKLSVVRHPS